MDKGKNRKKITTKDDMLAPIDIFLDDHLLEEVFCYLSPIELIVIERVSKRWQEISLKSWRNKKKLSFDPDLGYRFPLEYIEKILRRGGKYLSYLDTTILTFYPIDPKKIRHFTDLKQRHYPDKKIYEAISMYCPNLEVLNLFIEENCRYPSGVHLPLLNSSVIQNLKRFEIHISKREAEPTLEGYLTGLLQKAKKAEEFILSTETCIKGSCLLTLPKACKKLFLYYGKIDEDIFKKVLENLPNLKCLEISSARNVRPETVSRICPNLESFKVIWCENLFKRNGYVSLSLKNVRVFDISENENVDNVILGKLIKKMPLLEELTIRWAKNVTNRGFCSLEKLEHLKVLDICYNDHITDETLIYLAKSLNKLEKVFCQWSSGLTCRGLFNLIDSCKKLQYVLTGNCFNFTDDFLKSVLKSVDERPNNVSLTIDMAYSVPVNSKWLVPYNDRQLKYNYCKVKGREPIGTDAKWEIRKPIIRYVSSSSISKNDN